MFKLGSIGIFLAALVAAAPVAGENRTVTFPAAADATLQNGVSANRNVGAATPLTLRAGSWPIVQFDLATLPGLLGPEGAVTSAELALYVESAFGFPDEQIGLVAGPVRDITPPSGFAEIYIGRLGAPWTEAGVTWNCPVDSLPANTTADCSSQWAGGQQIGADTAVLSIANGERGRRGVDLAADVRRFAAGMPNHGWRLRLFDPVLVPGTATFTSREGFAANRPQLVVAYDTDATPPAVTFTAPAGRFVLADPRPLLALSFSDLGSGVDAASFRLQVDGADRTTWCVVTATGSTCRPTVDLVEGVHSVSVTLRDHDGETTTVTRIVDVLLGPGPFTRDWPATADATIRADLPTSPEGTSATVRVQANAELRGLLRFDLDELAELAGVAIDSAELRLSVASREALGAAGLAVGVHRLTTDWSETEASWSCPRDLDPNDGLPCSGAGWTAGGAFEPTADASFVVADATPAAVAADVTAGVRAALPTPHGWLLRFLAAPASGRPIVRFGSREGAAGAAPVLRVTFRMPVLDPTPPTIAISAPSGLLVNQPRPVVSLAYADASGDLDPATLALEVDGADRTALCTLTAATASCPVGPLGPGTHTLVARISDRAGHVATATGSLELVLDELPPSVAFRAPARGSLSAPSPPVLELSWSDADSAVAPATFRFALDGADRTGECQAADGGARCTLGTLASGPHVFEAQVADRAGNVGIARLALDFVLDATAPTLSFGAPAPGTHWLAEEPLVAEVTWNDTGSGVDPPSFHLTQNGVPVDGCDEPTPTGTRCPLGLETGPQALVATVGDRAGNLGTASLGVVFGLDVERPVVRITEPALESFLGELRPRLAATYSDVGSGVDPASGVLATLDGAPLAGCAVTAEGVTCVPGVHLSDGSHTLAVAVTDRAGNGAAAHFTFALAAADRGAPELVIVAPEAGAVVRGDSSPEVRVEFSDALSGIDPDSLALVLDGVEVAAPCTFEPPSEPTSATCTPSGLGAGLHGIEVRVADVAGNETTTERFFTVELALAVAIESPANGFLTRADTIELAGTADPAVVEVALGELTAPVTDGRFTISGVPLVEGSNTLTVVATSAGGGVGTATVSVIRDTTPPRLTFVSPPAGHVTATGTITVTGEVHDAGSSNAEAAEVAVVVEGVPADVVHGAFLIPDLPLQPGENVLRAVATDRAGNRSETYLAVVFLADAVVRLEEAQGAGQEGEVGSPLPRPLVVRVTDAIGNPLPGREVEFRVRRGDGTLAAFGQRGDRVTVAANALGYAEASFTLGARSGMGNHEVEAQVTGFPGSVLFCSSALPAAADRIVRLVGNNHTGVLTGAAGMEYPKPLLTQVFDRFGNPVPGVPVTYEVVTGGGSFGGAPTTTVTTDADGQAGALFRLGESLGTDTHAVQAGFPGLTGPTAIFLVSGLPTGAAEATRFSGLVLDNEDRPVPGVTVGIADRPDLVTTTGADGRFALAGVPVGTIHLRVDGGTTPRPGTWPRLEYETTTVPGQDNSLGLAIRLLPIDVDSARVVGGDADVTLPIRGVEGGQLTVFAHSATFADGSRVGPLSITQVHADKTPRAAPMGSNFMLAWTIQPHGVRFDPPARIEIPNLGARPGTVVDVFTFDHDLGEFVSAGPAEVTADGLSLRSRPGFGVTESGWGGCVSPPLPPTDVYSEGRCSAFENGRLVSLCNGCDVCGDGGCQSRAITDATLHPTSRDGVLYVGLDARIDFSVEIVGDCSAYTYEWDFGDGTTSVERAPPHVYSDPGDYTVSVKVSCTGCNLATPRTATTRVRAVLVDLEIDELAEEDEEEVNELTPGAFLLVNDDDDDRSGQVDGGEYGVVEGENDLREVALNFDAQEVTRGQLRMEARRGGDHVRLWTDQRKGGQRFLPLTWNLSRNERPPESLWLEGATASLGPRDVELRLVYQPEDGTAVEDSARATVLALRFEVLPDEAENVTAAEPSDWAVATVEVQRYNDPDTYEDVDGAELEWEVESGSVSLGEADTESEDGLSSAAYTLPAANGSTGRLRARLVSFPVPNEPDVEIRVDRTLATGDLVVVPGPPVRIDLAASALGYPADGTSTISFTAELYDAAGNPVADGTPVSWQLDESATGFRTVDLATSGHTARAVVEAPLDAIDQVLTVAAGAGRASQTILVARVTGALTASTPSLDLDAGASLDFIATFTAADGTPVFWTSSNGTVVGGATVQNGRAIATLTSEGAFPGVIVVTANAGDRMLTWQGEAVSSRNAVRVERRFLVAGADGDGTAVVSHGDGTSRTVPIFGETRIVVRGTPGTRATFAMPGALPGEAFTFDSTAGSTVPGVFGRAELQLQGGAQRVTDVVRLGAGALRLPGGAAAGTVADVPLFDFETGLRVEIAVRPARLGAATLVAKGTSYGLRLLADGRVEGSVTTTSGVARVVSARALELGRWQRVELQLAGGALSLGVDGPMTAVAAFGTLEPNDEDVVVGAGFEGHLDDLRLDPTAGAFAFLRFDGVDAAGQMPISEDGTAIVMAHAQGELPDGMVSMPVTFAVLTAPPGVQAVTGPALVAELESVAQGVEVPLRSVAEIQLQERQRNALVRDVLAGFVGLDTETEYGQIANIVGGLFVVADIGSVAKNLWRLGFDREKFNAAELALSSIGILTEVFPAADLAVSAARSMAARFGNRPAVRAVVKRVVEYFRRGREFLTRERTLFGGIVEDPDFARAVDRVVESEDDLARIARLGEALCPSVAPLRTSEGEPEAAPAAQTALCPLLATVLTEVTAQVGPRGVQLANRVLVDLSPAALVRLGAATDVRLVDAISGIARAAERVDPSLVRQALDNGTALGLNAAYSEAHLAVHLGELARLLPTGAEADKGFQHLVKGLHNTNPNSVGFRFEVQAAIWSHRNLGPIALVSEPLRRADGKLLTDIDAALGNGIQVQVKASRGALRSLSAVKRWVGKVIGSGRARSFSDIAYILPPDPPVSIQRNIQQFFQAMAIRLHRVPLDYF